MCRSVLRNSSTFSASSPGPEVVTTVIALLSLNAGFPLASMRENILSSSILNCALGPLK